VVPVLDEQAAVLHHVDARGDQLPGRLVVADPQLEPHRLRPLRDDVVEVRRDVLWAAEDVHQVHHFRNVFEPGECLLPQDLGFVRIHRNDPVTLFLKVFCNLVAGPPLMRGQPDDGNRPGRRQNLQLGAHGFDFSSAATSFSVR
jgi:hypothetical protein